MPIRVCARPKRSRSSAPDARFDRARRAEERRRRAARWTDRSVDGPLWDPERPTLAGRLNVVITPVSGRGGTVAEPWPRVEHRGPKRARRGPTGRPSRPPGEVRAPRARRVGVTRAAAAALQVSLSGLRPDPRPGRDRDTARGPGPRAAYPQTKGTPAPPCPNGPGGKRTGASTPSTARSRPQAISPPRCRGAPRPRRRGGCAGAGAPAAGGTRRPPRCGPARA